MGEVQRCDGDRSRANGRRRQTAGRGIGLALAGWVAAQALPGACGAAAAAAPSGGAQRVEAATDVVGLWRPDQHLYVKGNLGVGSAQLDSLEGWLRAEARNWTVVLLEHADDERFRDVDGKTLARMDAVEQALGTGLPNRTGFGQLTDARTQERNGALFVLFLRERKFSYFGSDAQDRRGLGEERWAGQLDQPAVAAMRGGGRIVDAVRDTITGIDRQLTQRIGSERIERERREAEAQAARAQALERARSSLAMASNAVGRAERAAAAMTGDLARPGLAGWRGELEAARAALEAGNVPAVTALADPVARQADEHARRIESFRQLGPELARLEQRMAGWPSHPHHGAAMAASQEAQRALEESRQAHQRGDAAAIEKADLARGRADEAEARMRAAEQTARQREEAEARAARLRRQAAAGGGAAAAAGAGALLFGLNRRRRGPRSEALALVQTWTAGLNEKTVALFDLLDRVRTVLGGSTEEVAERYAGRTLEAGQRIIRDVDELSIMSACAGRVLGEAQALIEPAGWGGRARAWISAGPYREAIRRLRDEPIRFRPEEGLELVIRGPRTERETLLGHLESYQPFTMTFTELIDAFNERAGRALTGLESVQSSILRAGPVFAEIEKAASLAASHETDLQRAREMDSRFTFAEVFASLLPAARLDHAEAVRMACRDAMGALEGPAAAAQRKAGDAAGLVGLGMGYHLEIGPALAAAAGRLQGAGRDAGWIEAAVTELSAQSEELASRAQRESVAREIREIGEGLNRLRERAEAAIALEESCQKELALAVEEAGAEVQRAREELGRDLGLAPGELLVETGRNPTEAIGRAREQLEGVRAALDRGDLEGGRDGFDAGLAAVAAARGMVEATRSAWAARADAEAAWRAETNRLTAMLPEHEQILDELLRDYEPAALRLGEGDPVHPNANGTAQDNLKEAEDHLARCRSLGEDSGRAFRAGRILEGSELMEQAAAHQQEAAYRLMEIVEKRDRVRRTEASNEELQGQLEARQREIEGLTGDPRTMAATVEGFRQAVEQLERSRVLAAAGLRNPFARGAVLAAAGAAFEQVAARVRQDWEAHAEAERSLRAAASQIEGARRLAEEARGDAVADSGAILGSYGELDALGARHAACEPRLLEAHGDWGELDREADRLAAEAGRVAAALRGELEQARAALEAVSRASNAVRSASGWAGGWGVLISGSPGGSLLQQARGGLERGVYAEARRMAEQARRAAELAIAEAEAEMLRRRRAEEERQERERRRRAIEVQRRLSTQRSPSSSFGRSVFSSGSGMGRSSFSRGSGMRRSGW